MAAREVVLVVAPDAALGRSVVFALESGGFQAALSRRVAEALLSAEAQQAVCAVVDEQGIEDRNAILACLPERQLNARTALEEVMGNTSERWSIRRGRPRGSGPASGSQQR